MDLTVERLVGLVQHAAVAFGMFALLRPFGRRIATVAARWSRSSCSSVPVGLSAMAWNGALGLGICAAGGGHGCGAAATDGPGARRMLALAGVLGGAALLYRPDMVLAVGRSAWARSGGTRPSRGAGRCCWGLVLTLLLYVPHLLVSGIGESIQGMFLEPVFELRDGRALPVPPSWDEIDGFLQRAGTFASGGVVAADARPEPPDPPLVLAGAPVDPGEPGRRVATATP